MSLTQLFLRLEKVAWARFILAFGIWAIISRAIYMEGGIEMPALPIFVVATIAGLMVGKRGAYIFAVLSIITTVVVFILGNNNALPVPTTSANPLNRAIALGVTLILTAVLLTTLFDNLRDTLTQLRVSNRELKRIQASLEARVQERVQDLTLAADVSRAISQIRDLDSLLAEATELIRQRFNLYYAQIYLMDDAKRSLVLRAGTGAAGKALLERQHRLVVDKNSINGTAAVDKTAVIVPNTTENNLFLPNPMLPATRSEMAIPLLIGNEIVGVLNLQSANIQGMTPKNLPAFETLAGQLAIAIQNARLFSEVVEARTIMEAQTKRLTHQGWQDFLDGLARNVQIGYEYTASHIRPSSEALLYSNDEHLKDSLLTVPVNITGTKIGVVQLEAEKDRSWNADDYELVKLVAREVGQHIDGLRLIAQAEQYRAEAEQASQQLENSLKNAQEKATQEQLINKINQKILQTDSVEQALQTAIQELEQAL